MKTNLVILRIPIKTVTRNAMLQGLSLCNAGVSYVSDPTQNTFHTLVVRGSVIEQLVWLLPFKKRTALLWFPQKQQWDNLKIHTQTHPVGKYMR